MRRGLELWAGAECTVNRVQDRYFDQVRQTGHHTRLEDLDRFAELGATSVRFPVLWERVAPRGLERASFEWSDRRLERLRALRVRPIVGLLHHGSGPLDTHLCDPEFPDKFAKYARAVAERYPWVDAYTPVNEPLTTARFSALYGHWYPHQRDTASFLTALIHQIIATQRAMREIRAVNPSAEFYQTEDAGHTFATEPLASQARYENDRRWLTFDLLFGRVGRAHPLRQHLEEHGIDARVLDALVDEPCAPDLVGLNYYVTSDRFLDHRRERYPESTWGGNGFQSYADVEAVRVLGRGILGHGALLEEAFSRYQAPCAITEVHLGCHREEQLRWFREAWNAARSAQQRGVDVRAVTLWAMFGSVDWSSLVTEERNEYEPGAFDSRFVPPRRTAVFDVARALGAGQEPECPGLAGDGWWRCDARLVYPVVGACSSFSSGTCDPPLLIVGESALATHLSEVCGRRRLRWASVAARGLRAVEEALARTRSWGVALTDGHCSELCASRTGSLAEPFTRVRVLSFADHAVARHRQEPSLLDAALDLLIDSPPGKAIVL